MNNNHFDYNILNSSFSSHLNIDSDDIMSLMSIYEFNYNETSMILNDNIIFKKLKMIIFIILKKSLRKKIIYDFIKIFSIYISYINYIK